MMPKHQPPPRPPLHRRSDTLRDYHQRDPATVEGELRAGLGALVAQRSKAHC